MIIKFEDVSKKFSSNITALEDINLSFKGGEFVFVVGPSGAGKSTLLRLLSREYPPTTGKILVGDIDLSKLKSSEIPKYRKEVGFVFQDFKLLDDRTVFENVALALEVREVPETEINKEVERILRLFEIWDRKSLFPAQLSGGEAQRTAIARAMVGKPKMLLADEPTGDLDPNTSWQVLQLLSEINSWGTTVIMATHNVEIVNTLKRRVVVIRGGKIIKDKKEGKYEIH